MFWKRSGSLLRVVGFPLKDIAPDHAYRTGGKNAENTLRSHCARDAAVLGNLCPSPSEHRYRTPQREHRDQPSVLPGTRPGAGLPGLLRATSGSKLLLLRRYVLGLPE